MQDRMEQLIKRMLRHGATRVEFDEIFREGQVTWEIGPDDELSEVCIHLYEFILNGARNARRALQLIDRIRDSGSKQDVDLLTALKKYVEDTCESIKVVDNTLKENGTSLETLLFEIPQDTSDDEMSWRNLIGRRDVIAHNLLTVDDNRTYEEAVRDFWLLYQLLSNVCFGPVKTSLATGRGFASPVIKGHVLTSLLPSKVGHTPRIGNLS